MSVRIIARPGGWLVIDPRRPEPDPETGRRETIWLIQKHPLGPWVFNGNVERPSIAPSYRMSHPRPDGSEQVDHFFITGWSIGFCSDSTHEWSGLTLELPEFTAEELTSCDEVGL